MGNSQRFAGKASRTPSTSGNLSGLIRNGHGVCLARRPYGLRKNLTEIDDALLAAREIVEQWRDGAILEGETGATLDSVLRYRDAIEGETGHVG